MPTPLILNDTPTPTLTWLGVSYQIILSSAASNGALSIVRSVSKPGSGPPRHIHLEEDETFVILSGRCEFWLAGEVSFVGPGETLFIPRGTEHTFQVLSPDECEHLVILTPGGFEQFFVDMADGQFRIPEDMEAINESAARHHLSFTGPPLEMH